MVTEDDSNGGRLAATGLAVPTKSYQSSLAGGRPLVSVSEPAAAGAATYRAQNDATWVRYQRFTTGDFWWRAYAPDGTTYIFGDRDGHTSGCSIVSDSYAPLTRMIDPFGNEVDYVYEAGVDGECRIRSIAWGANVNASVGHFAGVFFGYAASPPTCSNGPVGSQTSWRTGTKIVTGASQLDHIIAAAFAPRSTGENHSIVELPSIPVHVRVITLSYSTETPSCTAQHAPFRSLTTIHETAQGVDSPAVTLPDVVLGYGNPTLLYPSPTTAGVQWGGSWLAGPPTGVANTAHNLGWGLRFTNGRWPTVEAMMIDVDGDGLVDRLTSDPFFDEAGHLVFCRARWERNLGPTHDGDFQFAGYINMPTLKWATDVTTQATATDGAYHGGPYATANPTTGANERCALNYQQTGYVNSNDGQAASGLTCGIGDPSCAVSGSCACPMSGTCDNGDDCTPKVGHSGNTVFAWRWMDVTGDGLPDLVGSPAEGGLISYRLQRGNGIAGDPQGAPIEPPIFTEPNHSFPGCPSTPFTAIPPNSDYSQPYTMCGGAFPWFVYKNNGHGNFGRSRPVQPPSPDGLPTHNSWGPLPDAIMYQPIPLESTTGESSVTSLPVTEDAGTVDLDGDGFLDAVYRGVQDNGVEWGVFRNDGTGQFVRNPVSLSPFPRLWFEFGVQVGAFLTRTDLALGSYAPYSTEGLFDFNNDGLVDHWDACAGCSTANVQINDGLQFRQGDGITASSPGSDGLPLPGIGTCQPGIASCPPSYFVYRGERIDSRRTLDVDLDGRPDIVHGASGVQDLEVEFNQGGQFGAPAPMFYGDDVGSLHRIVVNDEGGTPLTWEVRSDMTDLDGDGIPESVAFGAGLANPGSLHVEHIPTPTAPPRLLTSIDNNRGATTTVSYSPMSGAAVTQHPELNKASPQTQWVVQSVTTTDALSNTTSVTSYQYLDPKFNADDRGHHAFRGFEEVRTTSPSHAKTIERYSYAPDWSGRLTTRLVQPSAEEATVTGEIRSIDETTWEERGLFSGAVRTYHPTIVDHWTCRNGQDEIACRGNTDTRTRSLSTLTLLASTTNSDPTPLLWQETESRLQTGEAAAAGDRRTITTYALAADADTYRLRQRRVTKQHQATLTAPMQTYAQSETRWDASFRVPENEDVWLNASGDLSSCALAAANCATTHREYDMTTGNVTARRKPVQNSANGASATFDYDARKLFVIAEHSEPSGITNASQERDYVYEYGTGTKLETIGPNVAPCFTSPLGCPPGSSAKEDHRIRVDGLGRMIERYETFTNGDTNYRNPIVETNTYVDGNPSSITHQSAVDGALDLQPVRYAQDQTDLDGHGRPTKQTVFALGSAPADAVTTFTYKNDGTVATITLPDPSTNDTSTVTYTYDFDSIGRPTGVRRPDSAADPSGIDIAYDGMTATTAEHVGTAGGQVAVTRTTKDAFGRLVQVDEQVQSGPMWATTTYAYGPDDNVVQVRDPEGVTTALVHDLGGRRTQITRPNGRTWAYGYDKNGNMASEIVPGFAADLSDIANFTTTIAYDDLDRPISKLVAPRNLSSADRALFGSDVETYQYDYNFNGTGRIYSWGSYGPGASQPTTFVSPVYNAQGQPLYLTQATAGIADSPALLRLVGKTYYLNGATQFTSAFDMVGAATATTQTYMHLDARGLPARLDVDPGSSFSNYIVNTRNVAGLVTKQQPTGPINGSASWPNVESDWTYDALGRVTSQHVLVGSGPTLVAGQDLAYFGNDDPRTLDQYLPTGHKQFGFTFDLRHQLTGAVENTSPGYFSAAYQYGTAGRFGHATETSSLPSGSDVKPRDVSYIYGGADPEELTELRNPAGSMFASYEYDGAGNQTYRCEGQIAAHNHHNEHAPEICIGTSMQFLYDGKDQLRRATKMQNGAGAGSEEYWYDLDGQRIITLKRDQHGNKTEMIWWIGDVEAHYDGTGTVTHVYSYLTMGGAVARVDRVADTTTNIEYQFHGLGSSTLAAVDQATGTVNASFSYAPFGEVIEATNAGLASGEGIAAHRRRLNDKFVDEISDLGYYGSRYYDKTAMTWTQGDPLFRFAPDAASAQPRRAQLYSFSLNNPIRYRDPDGRNPEKKYDVIVQDLSRNEDQRLTDADAYETGSLIISSIAESFRPHSGGTGDQLLQSALAGTIAKVTRLSGGGNLGVGPGTRIIIVDLSNPASIKDARKAGAGELIGKLRVSSGAHSLAEAEVGGRLVVVSLDRIMQKIKDAHLSINNKEDREKIQRLVEWVVAHEVGHNLGLTDNEIEHDLMNRNTPSFSDRILTEHMKSDIDKAAESLGRRAQ